MNNYVCCLIPVVENNSVYEHGLLNEDLTPRPVYNRLYHLFHEEWRTNLSTSLNRNGELNFRGFFGDYEIIVKTPDGKVRAFKTHIGKNEENRWVFNLD